MTKKGDKVKATLFGVLLLVFPAVAFSTQVSGDVWGVWDSTMNPIEVVGELRVPPDSSLIIGPGCYIEFQDYYALTLDTSAAFIRAIGTEEDSIVFTPAPGRVWNGIDIFFADSASVFSYCIIEKAHAPLLEDVERGSGGAIHCEISNLEITQCRITNNRARDGMGGGIFLWWGDLYLTDHIISNNFCGFGGSALNFWDGNAVIVNNIFESDTTFYPLGTGAGGPVRCTGCSLLTFSQNVIRNNLSYGMGIVYLRSSYANINNNVVSGNLAWGGRSGFYITINDSGSVSNNEITHNGHINSGGGTGGGMCLVGSNIRVNNNIIAHNAVWPYGGGIYLNGTNIALTNNVIANNQAISYAGGIYLNGTNIALTNNVIANNWANSNAGGIYLDNTSYQIPNTLKSNIIWGNVANNNPQIYNVANRPLEVNYCDVEGGWQGVGNIDIDPLFRDTANGDFHLMSTFCGDPYDSPCIDVGDPTIEDIILDCDWGLGSQLSDMGAYGGGDSTLQTIEDYQPPLPLRPTLLQNYPNPFNASTNIEFALQEQSYISIIIYDIMGREVEILFEGLRQPGAQYC
jgi:hypothetical protein